MEKAPIEFIFPAVFLQGFLDFFILEVGAQFVMILLFLLLLEVPCMVWSSTSPT